MDNSKRKNILIVIFIITTIIASILAIYFAILKDSSYKNNESIVTEEPNNSNEENIENSDNSNINTDNEIKDEENNEEANQNTDKNYNINDYVLISDFEVNKNCTGCKTHGIVKTIEFKNLPLGITYEFTSKHSDFIHPISDAEYNLKNEFIYGIDKNILSVYCFESIGYINDAEVSPETWPNYTDYNFYSLNVNLDNNKFVTNQELLELYNINPQDMFEKILNNIANTVTIGTLLLTPNGDVSAKRITIDEFRKNIKSYAKTIDNRYDVVTLYLKDNKLNVVYEQNNILSILGMGSNNGIGLVFKPQSLELN